jgi:flavin-dependent dehydrogenase
MLRIMIAGGGISGSYLWRLLVRRGMNPAEIEIVDPGPRTRCGISPCGFAVTRQFSPLCKAVGLEPEKYIVATPEVGYANEVKFNVKGYVFSIDKPAFIRDLLEGAFVNQSPSDIPKERVIDATGIARAYIGKYEFDILYPCIQKKVSFPQSPVLRQSPHHIGYSWVIPLEGSNAHVGIGSITHNAETMANVIERLAQGTKTICGCHGFLRGTGPILPLVRGNVWAVGEAAGLVDPLIGAGIVPAMVSAKLLVDNWDDSKGYEIAIIKKYGWFRKTSELVQEWQDRGVLNINKLLAMWRNYGELAGLDTGISSLVRANTIRNAIRIALHVPSVQRHRRTNQAS